MFRKIYSLISLWLLKLYKGIKPAIEFYKDGVDRKLYDLIPCDYWDAEKTTIDYLTKDLISLYQVIRKFSGNLWLNHKIHLSTSRTISSLAFKIYLSSNRFYKNNIPLIRDKTVYDDIRKSYFGGITEVYKPEGKDLYYYDVNSLYPYAALNPMPGCIASYDNNINTRIDKDSDLFGFFYCEIQTSNLYYGLLPYHSNGIIMPNGAWRWWYFSEELKFAALHGYSITVIKGYYFNQEIDVFKEYVNHFYKIKSTTKNMVEKQVSKSLLNNLIGRFGLNIHKTYTELLSTESFKDLVMTKKVLNFNAIGELYLVNYMNKIDRKICQESGVDYRNTLINDIKDKKIQEECFDDVSIAIASAVNSYARIFMNKVKLALLKKGGSVYYTDTDSLVTDIPLEPELVGNELGQFKLEYRVAKAYFVSNKTF
uniref:DNA polymerase type B domain-containing protein n=1 Tax=Erysiphe quercicola TaxID=425177 RepID=UPI00233E9AE5|nr:DNA polymerase type B domain-containing protein [Erysiphe quercicola]WBR75374.1 DNA polymerase type B domain-containing protein [Erysiphe quercicola]